MAEPNIVFCSSNHIYDAAIYGECPYCKKISEEQKALSATLGINEDASELPRNWAGQSSEDFTELLDDEGDSTELLDEEDHTELLEDEEDHTELLSTGYEDLDEDEEDHTELLNSSTRQSMKLESNYVIGWLVFRNGKQKGNCLEIRESINYLYSCEDKIIISESNLNKGICLGAISKTNDTFTVHPYQGVGCGTNGVQVNRDVVLRNYDLLTINEYKFTFVELLTEFVDWSR